uniref:Defensin-like protein n=1 Tax=Cajanus cajan TaxID=3821 RepID=A0A151QXR2_CAJCA|nr:hypothetical protein KK1_043857 [Cajanus cajan]
MKPITSILVLLLVLSTSIENEGPLKVVEAQRCKEILYNKCEDNDKCFNVCRKKHGNLASGVCDYKEDCICQYPC